jgi:anti-sigma regulatory factor (Ser/Thr protein kinase)
VSPAPAAVRETRHEVADILVSWKLPAPNGDGGATDDVLLVVSELMTNAVRHGGPELIGISIELRPDLIRIEIYDGNDFIPGPAGPTPGTRDEDGRGLFLVEALAKTITWEPTARGKRCVVDMARP